MGPSENKSKKVTFTKPTKTSVDLLGDYLINYFKLEEDRYNYRKTQKDHVELELITTIAEKTIRHEAEIHAAIDKFYKRRTKKPYIVLVKEQLNQVRFNEPCNIYTITKKKIYGLW